MRGIWKDSVTSPEYNLKQVLVNLNKSGSKIVLVVNPDGKLLGTISDGDVRRGLLNGLSLDSPIASLIHHETLTLSPNVSRDRVLKLMLSKNILQIPIVAEDKTLLGLHLWSDLVTPVERENLIIIFAGGKGTRLRPHTEDVPKPMLTVSGMPMLEIILNKAKAYGFKKFIFAIHHRGDVIEDYFKDGKDFGVDITYLREKSPLGTAGALSLLEDTPLLPFIVTNGDVITEIDYGDLVNFHQNNSAVGTMAVHSHEFQNPYGVIQTTGIDIIEYVEKPTVKSIINAGVYVLSPEALKHLSLNESCDMPSLFARLQDSGERTVAYQIFESWMDVGSPIDLVKANSDFSDELGCDENRSLPKNYNWPIP